MEKELIAEIKEIVDAWKWLQSGGLSELSKNDKGNRAMGRIADAIGKYGGPS